MLQITDRPRTTLLINPPLWNAYAPHLAVPLLAGALRAAGLPARCHDASTAVLDWLLSSAGMEAVGARLGCTTDRHLEQRARLVHPWASLHIDEAKRTLRSVEALHEPDLQVWARTIMRDAMTCVSAAFEDLRFDLVANTLYYAATSTADVLAAIEDPERNVYRWAIDTMLPDDLLADSDLGQVGISVSADTQLIAALTIAAKVRRCRPDVVIIMGGNFTTRMVDRWGAEPHPFFDLVDVFVREEGEESLPEIVRRLAAGAGVAGLVGVPGVCVVQGGHISRTKERPVRLDLVPVPDFEDLPLDKYFAPGPILPLFASRSCAWSCAFCSIPFASNNFRRQSASVTVDHIEHLMRTYGTRYFMFVDEILTPSVLRDVAQEIVDRRLDVRWYGETRFAGSVREELSALLYRSGCRRLNFGLESYNQRVLDLMRKGTRLSDIDAGVQAMLQSGIAPHLFVIHGFPGETREEAERTVSYAQAVVARSASEFGNPYTTWGGAPFVLDVHSPVGQQPEMFGIRALEPPASHDLSLARDFTLLDAEEAGSVGGEPEEKRPDAEQLVGQREAVEIAARARGHVAIERNVWFRSQDVSTLTEVEEFTFMRASVLAPPARERRMTVALHELPIDGKVELTATLRRMPWPAGEDELQDAVALYNGERDTFIQLAWPRGTEVDVMASQLSVEALASWFRVHNVAWGECTGFDLVRLMHRHGFVDVHGVSTVACPARPTSTRFAPEPVVLEAADSSGSVLLHSPVTGATVRLGPIAEVVWTALRMAPTSPSEAVNELLGEEFSSWEEDAAAAAFALAERGLAFPATIDHVSSHAPSGATTTFRVGSSPAAAT